MSKCRWSQWFPGVVVAAPLSVLDAAADVVRRHDSRGEVACSRNTLSDHTSRPALAAMRHFGYSMAAFVWDGVEECSRCDMGEERRRSRSRDLTASYYAEFSS